MARQEAAEWAAVVELAAKQAGVKGVEHRTCSRRSIYSMPCTLIAYMQHTSSHSVLAVIREALAEEEVVRVVGMRVAVQAEA